MVVASASRSSDCRTKDRIPEALLSIAGQHKIFSQLLMLEGKLERSNGQRLLGSGSWGWGWAAAYDDEAAAACSRVASTAAAGGSCWSPIASLEMEVSDGVAAAAAVAVARGDSRRETT